MTCKPPLSCRVTSKVESSRGKAAMPASLAISARTFSSAARSRCSPVSGTSVVATRTRHGCPLVRLGAIALALRFSRMDRHPFRIGKGDFAALKSILRGQPVEGLAAIGRKPCSPKSFRSTGKDVAGNDGGQFFIARRGERISVGRLPAIECLSDQAHLARDCEVPNSHFAHVIIHIAAEAIEQPLPQVAAARRRVLEPAENQYGVEHDHLQSAVNGIGYPIDLVEGRASRLRHDGAIEARDAAFSQGGDKPAEYHWVS